MRTLLGGLLLLWIAIVAAGVASAQVVGRVETIGLDGLYRPGCWTPMFVKLQSQGSPTGLYELRVWQQDADGDRPYFSTRVTLTAGRGEQGFWTYFLPEPIHGGLTGAVTTAKELQQRLRVTVHDAGGRELTQVTVGNSVPQSVDPISAGFDRERGRRFVVFVAGGTGAASPPIGHYDTASAGGPPTIVGLQEDLASVRLRFDQLPESALGYDGVDALVWLDGDPQQLATGGSRRLDAIRNFVARGGQLVISTPPSWQQLLGFGDLMPVDIESTEPNPLQSPARQIANAMPLRQPPPPDKGQPRQPARANPWDRFREPFTIAIATPRPGAVVDRYANRAADAQSPAQPTPWLVRRPLGYGCVTWVGQDLGARELSARANWGWPLVWETILGTGSAPRVFPNASDVERYRTSNVRDLGGTVLDAMNLSGRAAALIGVTVIFFILYWAIAGPGSYFLLRYRGRATASWFAFGAVALGATAVTLAVVRVVLRGSAEVKHVSLVRISGDRAVPEMAISRLGVYVPRDGAQAISLADVDPRFASTVTPFPIHPTLHRRRDGDQYLFPSPITYGVRVPTGDAGDAPSVEVPFRSTAKRLRAEWFSAATAGIDGQASLRPSSAGRESYINGTLINRSGVDLRNVYVAFRHQVPGGVPTLWMMYVAGWKAGDPLNLGEAFNPTPERPLAKMQIGLDNVAPNDQGPVRGTFANWATFFGGRYRSSGIGEPTIESDLGQSRPQSVPMLSFFEQFPPMENVSTAGAYDQTRVDLHRSGLRDWDVGNALIAGQLVIVAEADGVPLPVPLTIGGDPASGTGTTIYQFVLPLAPIPDPPATRPAATVPATTPVEPGEAASG